jgi:NAD(P)-dependent dehydrogenase (short-subunit alcohol dehydrogenase family)
MDLGLKGKVAIVTGSSDGIGYATAYALAREEVRVSYVPDGSLSLLRRAIASRERPVLSCWRCGAMFKSCLTSSD